MITIAVSGQTMNTLLPSCYDSDGTDSDQAGELDHDSREDLPLISGKAPSGTALENLVGQERAACCLYLIRLCSAKRRRITAS